LVIRLSLDLPDSQFATKQKLTQRREDAKFDSVLCDFASLRDFQKNAQMYAGRLEN